QAEEGIRDRNVTGVQTCALPIYLRTYRPWITEPGLWLQFDWGEGPRVPGADGVLRGTFLFCAWLAWSRFRMVIPVWDQTLPTLIACLDQALRRIDGEIGRAHV